MTTKFSHPNRQSDINPSSDSNNSDRIKKITDAVLSLPVLPTVTAKLLELVDNPKTSANALSNLVSKDQVLTAKILKIANSAFYGFSREIPTVQRAVVVLGFNSLREISLSMSVFNAFKGDLNNKYFNVSEFWRHSIAVGLGARLLALNVSYENVAVAFTAGLLHDLGKMVLNQYLPYDFLKIQDKVFEEGMSLKEAEIEVLGVEHSRVGAWLAGRWKLPDRLVEAILYHHDPLESEGECPICLLVHIADYLAFKCHLGSSGRKSHPGLSEEFLDIIENRFGLTEEVLSRLETELKCDFEVKASNLLSEVN
ncbi:MAG: HDOD domain-containing protein [Fibrobacteria bacterium]|nr:HDOD domain-containing protein [Fibrobacteria bacterium]